MRLAKPETLLEALDLFKEYVARSEENRQERSFSTRPAWRANATHIPSTIIPTELVKQAEPTRAITTNQTLNLKRIKNIYSFEKSTGRSNKNVTRKGSVLIVTSDIPLHMIAKVDFSFLYMMRKINVVMIRWIIPTVWIKWHMN